MADPSEGNNGYPSTAMANYTLGLLWLVYVSNQWARYIINYLYAISDDDSEYSISEACDLTTSEYGLLTGYGFSATFVVAGLFMGRAADSNNRKNIICAGCLIWSLATAGMGTASAFWSLLVGRLVLGFGASFSSPASYSTIADLFPPEQRPTANGIFASGVYIGGGIASVSEAIAEALGWRLTMYLCALCGGAVSVIMYLTATEPKRQSALAAAAKDSSAPKAAAGEDEGSASAAGAAEPELSAVQTVGWLLSDKHTGLLLAAASVRFMGGYAISGYLPTFFEDKFPDYATQYSYINAYVVAFGGFMSSYLGGKLTTAWIESGKQPDPSLRWQGAGKANYYVPALGCLGGIPFFLVCLYSSNFYVALLVGLLGEYFVAECWFGPYMTAMQAGVPSTMRGLAVATMMLTANFMGSLTSYVMGVIQDRVDLGYKSLETILCVAVVGTYLLAALLFVVASRTPPSAGEAKVAAGQAGTGRSESSPLLRTGNSNDDADVA